MSQRGRGERKEKAELLKPVGGVRSHPCLSVCPQRNATAARASERASQDTRKVRSAMTSGMSRARRENRSERRRRKGSSWGRRGKADSGERERETKGLRRGERERGGKEKGLILWSRGRPSSAWRRRGMPRYWPRASERISRTERGRKRGRRAGGAQTARGRAQGDSIVSA